MMRRGPRGILPAMRLAPPDLAAEPFADPLPPGWLFLSLEGRISRRTFWRYGVLLLLVLAAVLTLLLGIAGVPADQAEGAVNLLLLWPAVAVAAKRWHDRDRSAWWVLLNLLPLVGWLWALVDNGFLRGSPGPNRYGPPPPV